MNDSQEQLPRSRADHARLQQAVRSMTEGDLSGALAETEEILSRRPQDVDALRLAAHCHALAGNVGQALLLQEKAIDASGRLLALLLEGTDQARRFGSFDAAHGLASEAIARAASASAGEQAQAYLAMARVHMELGDLAPAREALDAALDCGEENAELLAWSAQLHEQLNHADEAQVHAEQALAADPQLALAKQVLARLAMRRGDHDGALTLLNQVLETSELTARNAALAWTDKARALDRLDQVDQAYAAYCEAGRRMRSLVSRDQNRYQGPFSPTSIARLRREVAPPGDYAPSDAVPPPVFLVGFPRSGTTLLDQMLASHDAVITLEEKDTLRALHDQYLPPSGDPAQLGGLNPEQREALREAYAQRVGEFLDWPDGQILVDKLPMNTALLPAIAHVFPDARIIVALRDPRDVCLSCFMQAFFLNDATVNFLSMGETCAYYRQVMSGLISDLSSLTLPSHLIRYEDLLDNPAHQLKGLCRFLEIPYSDALLDYRSTARQRAINTPSYEQVQKPLYRGAMGRWRRYQHLIEGDIKQLEGLVQAFGYAELDGEQTSPTGQET